MQKNDGGGDGDVINDVDGVFATRRWARKKREREQIQLTD